MAVDVAHIRRVIAGVAAMIVIVAPTAAAQDEGWSSMVELNATTLFGASSQTLASLATGAKHKGEGFTADMSARFRYGESEDQQSVKFVSARGWAVSASLDATPKGRISPFLLGTAEASLEKRIARRTSGGVGVKWEFAHSNTGSASISVAALGERTKPLSDSAVVVSTLARQSWRLKFDQKVDDRLKLTHATFYSPVFNSPSQYTVTTSSVASYAVTRAVAFTLTFTDNYDSQARSRGARSNSDGSVLAGIRANF